MRKRIPHFVSAIVLSAVLLSLLALCMGAAAPDTRDIAKLQIVCEGKVYHYSDDPITAPDHTIAETIARRKINAPLDEKLRMVDRCIAAGATWRDAVAYSFPLLHKVVDAVIADNCQEAKDSQITFAPNNRPMFHITRSQSGKRVDETKLYREIYIALRHDSRATVKITPEEVMPNVSTYDNIRLTHLRSRFSTDFSQSNENRKHNIALSLKKINGTVLGPGEEFSFNKVVGPRTQANGFAEAKIIVAGEYQQGYGGGVCQSSTTVYNAALRADMNITQVRNHTLLPSYVAPSFDAMVNGSSSDMCFVNTGDTPVFIRAVTKDGKATVEFYGTPLPYVISTSSKEISHGEMPQDRIVVDTEHKYVQPDTPSGEQVRVTYSHASLKSEGYIIYKDLSGRMLDRKKIRSDTYSKSVGLVAVAP